MDRNWDTDDFKDEDTKRTVKKVYICAYINEGNEGDGKSPPTNHWAAFLEISASHSIRLDMSPGYGSDGLRGKLQAATKRYKYTDKAIYMLSFEPTRKIKVGEIFNLINTKKRQKYNFTVEWEGCRFWIFTLVSDLEQAGFIPAESANTAWSAVNYYYKNPEGYEFREVRQGTFR